MNEIITIIIITAGAAAIASIAALLYWYAFRFEPVNFVLSRVRINLKEADRWGAGKNGQVQKMLTILHLSDFHLRRDRIGTKLIQFIESLKTLKPDFIFITGDLIEKDEYLPLLQDMLSGFDAAAGKFAVLGVHDYYNKSPREFLKNMVKRKKEYKRQNDISGLINRLTQTGIKVLRNESVFINFSNSFVIQIAGIEDSIIRKADIKTAFLPDKSIADNYRTNDINNKENQVDKEADQIKKYAVSEAMKLSGKKMHVLNNSGRIVICLTHTPDRELLCLLSLEGADIVLCGHTHGGQVRLPAIGALLSGCNIKTKYAAGLFYFKKFILYVSRGLGEGRYSPFMFYCQPEATLIDVYYQTPITGSCTNQY